MYNVPEQEINDVEDRNFNISFVFTDFTPKYTITHKTTAFAILGPQTNNIKTWL